MLLNAQEIQELFDGVWNGKYNTGKLPFWLFNKISDGFTGAAAEGWGNELGNGAIKDIELENALRENLYYFAAHKTAHELQDLQNIYLASDNKYQFVKKAMQLNEKYNWHWYDTEVNITTRLARSGREWRRIEENKDVYPLLKFLTVQDGNVRDEHAVLHGVVRPVDDDFWKTHFPPLGWNCRCRVQRMQSGAVTNLTGVQIPPVNELFKERVADSKRIWSEKHPYFQHISKNSQKEVEKMVKLKTESNVKKS